MSSTDTADEGENIPFTPPEKRPKTGHLDQTFKFADMKILFNEAVLLISPEKWKRCIEHVRQKVEPKMWELDNIIEVQIEPIVITVGDSSSSSISELESE